LKIVCVVGARPNFMKMAPILREFKKYPQIQPLLVHTGQHYDVKMSDVFFKDLGMPAPDIHLNVGSGSQAEQSGTIMTRFEAIVQNERPDVVLVVGDVTSTMACSITAAKQNIKVAHVEAGLRSFDMTMPEEINRKVTDCLSDFLFTTEKSGNENLRREGKKPDQIFFAGNAMIDSLIFANHQKNTLPHLPDPYGVVTLHRPSNVDDPDQFNKILEILKHIQSKVQLIFPMHPRTMKQIELFGYKEKLTSLKNLHVKEPVGYFDFLQMVKGAKFVMTDSGGIQEETTFLGVPCLTMRENTERPVTVEIGTNTLVGLDPQKIYSSIEVILRGHYKNGSVPERWDGRAAERIVSVLANKS